MGIFHRKKSRQQKTLNKLFSCHRITIRSLGDGRSNDFSTGFWFPDDKAPHAFPVGKRVWLIRCSCWDFREYLVLTWREVFDYAVQHQFDMVIEEGLEV